MILRSLLCLLLASHWSYAQLQVSELSRSGDELLIEVSDAGRAFNHYTLHYSPSLDLGSWDEMDDAFKPANSTNGSFRAPMDAETVGFFRISGELIAGAPTTMNPIAAGSLPDISGLGDLDVAGFFMAATETTWAEWRAVRSWALANGYDITGTGEGCGDNHPAHSLSWHDVLKWCNARSEQAGLTPVYTTGGVVYRSAELVPDQDLSADGYRLPSEMEWEFAARGGNLSQGFTYSGGDNFGEVGRYLDNSGGAVCDLDSGRGTWEVGIETANELGQHDMSGNLWEWCWDADGSLRRIRGGSWNDDAASGSMANRSSADPTTRSSTIGFRVVRKIETYAANQSPIVSLRTPLLEPNNSGRIFIISDSTAANYNGSQYPWRGWGQLFQNFMEPSRFTVTNRARGGRSSKSYIVEGLWDGVKAELQPGDFLLIQWGHNDRDWTKPERYTTTSEYRDYLRQYVNEARAQGVVPILVTPMVMNAWNGSTMRNVFTESGNDYAGSMKQVATELNVPLIDLNEKSHAYFKVLDYDTAGRYFYNTYPAGEYPNYPDGSGDGTHFQEMGALMMGKFVTEGFRELDGDPRVSALANGLKPQYPVSIQGNLPNAGRVSQSTEFPEGATFTIKALPDSGHSFISWKDGANQTFSTNSLTTFVMTPQSRRYTAYFDNSTAVAPPAEGTTIPGGVPFDYAVTLSAEAFDPDGSIMLVEYFDDGTGDKVGEATTPPFDLYWEAEAGTYGIRAEAVDDAGTRSVAAVHDIDTEVPNTLPTVALTAPANGSEFVAGATALLSADASDSDGLVTRVVFTIDGIFLGEDTQAPYAVDWTDIPGGRHVVGVRAYDDRGAGSTTSTATVSIDFATSGALLQEAEAGTLVGSFTVVADAGASGGQSVEAVSGPADSNYVEFSFDVASAGDFQLRARIKAIDGLHDSMFVSVDGAAADQILWDTARSTGYVDDYVFDRDGSDPLILTLSQGTHVVRFGYRENLFIDQVELESAP